MRGKEEEEEDRDMDLLPLVGVPIIGVRANSHALIRSHQLVMIVHPHAAPHNLANTRHEAVYALGDTQIGGVFFHVKRFDLDGEVRQENRPGDDVRHLALGRFGDIVSKLMGLAFFVEDGMVAEPFDGVGVAHA